MKMISNTQAELIKLGCLKIYNKHGQDISQLELAMWQLYNSTINNEDDKE